MVPHVLPCIFLIKTMIQAHDTHEKNHLTELRLQLAMLYNPRYCAYPPPLSSFYAAFHLEIVCPRMPSTPDSTHECNSKKKNSLILTQALYDARRK